MGVKPNPQETPKEGGGASNRPCLSGKATGSMQSQPKSVSMCTATSKTTGAGLPKPLEAHITQYAQDARHGALEFHVCPAGYPSCLGLNSPVYFLFPPSGIETFTLCLSHHCVLKSCQFFIFIGSSQLNLTPGGNFGVGVLNITGTVKTQTLLGWVHSVFAL